MPSPEGSPDTFSHCGNRAPHGPHTHSFAMNEGPYTVECLGTPGVAEMPEKKVRVVQVECVCGWKFATINLLFAESIMRRHRCANYVNTGKDDQAFEIIEELG